jgi:hypothetical protein
LTFAHRTTVVVLVLAGLAVAAGLVVFASGACPGASATDSCRGAAFNRTVVVGAAAASVGLLVTPFAFLGEYALRRRIAYRGAWPRAARRGLISGATVAALGALRLGGALSVPGLILVVLIAALLEWFSVRQLDGP